MSECRMKLRQEGKPYPKSSCAKCGTLIRANFKCAEGRDEPDRKGEHRAQEAIAGVLCDCHFTDGFCIPRDRPDCKCNRLAAQAVAAIKTRGVELIWAPPAKS